MLRRRSRNMKQKKTWFKKGGSKTGVNEKGEIDS